MAGRSRAGDPRLVAAHEFFRRGEANAEGWSMLIAKGRNWESAYRDRWRHDSGLGGFFPPIVMGIVKSATGGYAVGFLLMALVGVVCLIVLRGLHVARPAPAATW